MELHHNWKVYASGPGYLLLAVAAFFSPQLLAATGQEFALGDWIGYAMAVILVGGCVMAFREASKPLRVQLGPEGVLWHASGKPVSIRWQDVMRVSIEQPENANSRTRPSQLIVWTAAPLEGVEPDRPLQGMVGYQVADLGKVRESREQVEGALQHFAPGRYQGVTR